MSFIGNALLGLAALILYYLVTSFYSKPIPGGDAGMGFALGVFVLNLAFVICMGIVALIISGKGGFEWVSSTKSTRTLYTTISIIAILIFTGLAGLLEGESKNFGGPARFILPIFYLLIPIMMIVISVILLNDNLRSTLPLAVYKWPSVFIVVVSLVGLASLLLAQIASSAKKQTAMLEYKLKNEDENHMRILADIDSCNVQTSMRSILVFSGDNQPENIQNAAVAKIKTNPEWEQELIRNLDTEWAPDVFQFLASNDVDHPSIFEAPLQNGVYTMANLFRERIRSCSHQSHFYVGMFTWDAERVIRAVDKFQSMEIDYLPAMKELRASMDEPSGFDKPKFTAITMLDKWIQQHS
jgi:hypothetical protein